MNKIPLGKLIPVGGAERRLEERKTPQEMLEHVNELTVLARVLAEAKGKNTRIEVVTTASSIPEVVGNEYVCSFESLGCSSVGIMNIRTRKQALQKEYLARVENADVVYFSGGNQIKITKAFADTPLLALLVERYYNDADFVIAGTSAGAMAMSSAMIFEGTSKEALTKGKAKITEGLSLLPNSIIDTHFVNRNRTGRLMVGVAEYRNHIGIGLAEDTAVIITQGRFLECIGSGQVCLIDGNELTISQMQSYDENEPLHFQRMIHHIMMNGHKFDVQQRVFLNS
jgi:cyanophycinase